MFGTAKKYKVDYNGDKQWFIGAKEAYKAGEKVTLYFDMIATDTNYYFYIDGEEINPRYESGKGYKILFTMPEHDVSVRVEAVNSMIYIPEEKKETVLTFKSFDGGGPSYSVKIEDKSIADYKQTKWYSNPNHENMCGCSFEVNISFIGLMPGETTATIECRSPIADNYDVIYDIAVDADMRVTVTEKERKELIRP